MLSKQEKNQRLIEKIALLLLSAEPNEYEPDRTFNIIANEAADMAYRANKAMTEDSSWWTVVGRPYFNERMARLRVALRKKK